MLARTVPLPIRSARQARRAQVVRPLGVQLGRRFPGWIAAAAVVVACSSDDEALSNSTNDSADASDDVARGDAAGATDDSSRDTGSTGEGGAQETDLELGEVFQPGPQSEAAQPMPPEPEWAGEYGIDCEGYGDKLVDCGVLTEGDYACPEPASAFDECVFICHAIASCAILKQFNCSGATPAPLSTCFEDCYLAYSSFGCGSGEYVPAEWACDAEPDCADGSDEAECEDYECESGQTIPASYVCDYESDCSDGSDELECPNSFECDNNRTIPSGWQCDAFDDCGDGSDEQGCEFFECAVTGERLPADLVCNQVHDCLDGSDEVDCAELVCH